VEIQLLQSTRDLLTTLGDETGIDPGWINNGGLYIAHNQVRTCTIICWKKGRPCIRYTFKSKEAILEINYGLYEYPLTYVTAV